MSGTTSEQSDAQKKSASSTIHYDEWLAELDRIAGQASQDDGCASIAELVTANGEDPDNDGARNRMRRMVKRAIKAGKMEASRGYRDRMDGTTGSVPVYRWIR